MSVEHFDVLIVGAGLSGIAAGYYLQKRCASRRFVILEGRGDLGGTFSASPVLVGTHIYATSEAGRTSIFQATPGDFHLIAENQLGNQVLATPTICGGRIYMRVAVTRAGQRQEMLYCLEKRN